MYVGEAKPINNYYYVLILININYYYVFFKKFTCIKIIYLDTAIVITRGYKVVSYNLHAINRGTENQ